MTLASRAGVTSDGHPRQRDMGADMRDAKILVRQHHAGVAAAGEVGEHVGVPGIGVAGEIDRLLGNRAGDDRGDLGPSIASSTARAIAA